MEKRKPGRPEGKSYPVQVNIYMTPAQYERVKTAAARLGWSVSETAREALRQWLERQG